MIEYIRYSLSKEESIQVKTVMKQKKITNKQLAILMGLSVAYINQFILGYKTFNLDQIQRFSLILDIDLLGNN